MNLKNTFIIALKSIWTNKVRSFLTTLGVIIGVSSVVMLIAIGKGLEAYITDQFESLGSNNVYIIPGDIFNENGGLSPQKQRIALLNLNFTYRDFQNVSKLREFVDKTTYYNIKSDDISFQNKSKSASILGTTHDYHQVRTTKIKSGQFFNKKEALSGEKVVVLGFKIAEELFGQADAIGKNIKLGNQAFKIVGVAAEIGGGSFGGPSFDTYAYIPFKTMSRVYNDKTISQILVKIKSKNNIADAIHAIKKEMGKNYKDDEFSVVDQTEILDVINNIIGILTIGLGGIAAISLLVGGIGIMNIMLVSVTERTKEIGLRKALGATPKQILLQFLIEAAILSIFGGLTGLILAFGGSILIQPFFPAKITWDAVTLAFGVSTCVGLIFGAAPADKASKLSPIEALRYE